MSLIMTTEEKQAQAKRALELFQTLIVTLYQPLLRTITGKPSLLVKPSANMSATDGKVVWLMVPWELGETREHDRSLCNKRDATTFKMLCHACEARDRIDSTVFHEAAHIVSGSFEEVDPTRIRNLVRQFCPFIDATSLKLPWHYQGRRTTAQMMASFIEPTYLPTLQNAVEDVYVNRRLFKARAGTEAGRLAMLIEVFTRGFHQADGTLIKWGEQPINGQAIMACYILGHHLPDLIDHLDPRVDVIKHDQAIIDLMEAIPGEGDAYIRVEIGLQLLARLRELDFCIPPSKQPPAPQPPTNPQPMDEEDEEAESQPGPQTDDEDDEDDDAEDGQGDSGDESDDEESDQESDDATSDDEPGEGAESDDEESDDEDAEPGKSGGSGSSKGTEESDDDTEDSDDAGEQSDDEGDDDGEESDDDDDGDEEFGSGSGSGADSDQESDENDEEDGEESGDAGPTQEELEELDREEAEQIAKMAKQMMGHEDEEQEDGDYTEPEAGLKPPMDSQDKDIENALDKAIRWQKFDSPPEGIHDYNEEIPDTYMVSAFSSYPIRSDPGLVSGETARLRTVFAANRKRRITGSLKSGPKLDVPNLHRIGQDDFRIFGKRDRPDKRDWFVLVGLDDSASTHTNGAAPVIREMGLALGEMLNGCGVKFAMYGHSEDPVSRTSRGGYEIKVRHLVIKGPDEPWTTESKGRLQAIGRDPTANYDGHTLEQYRKIIEKRRETDKMILYMTDGAMPMANFDEEVEILKRELLILDQRRIHKFAVGYRTDSPKQWGFDTIRIENGQDLPGLVSGLRQRLERS